MKNGYHQSSANTATIPASARRGVEAWWAVMAPLENGFVPALAAPIGATSVWLEPSEVSVVDGSEEPGVLPEDEEPGVVVRQEASVLAPTVIFLLQASLSSASTSDSCTTVPALMEVVQVMEVLVKSPISTSASPHGSEAFTAMRL